MSEAPSVRDSLTSAVAALSDAPEVVIDTAPAASAAPAAAPEPVDAALAPEAAGQVRDEHGRFKPKTPEATAGAAETATPQAPQDIETAKPAEKEPQSEAIPIPPSLPAAVKAKFKDLEPDVQQAFAKLEGSVQTAKAEWGRKGERLNRYDEIIGPYLDRWRLGGLDEFSGIQALISAQNILERNPVEGLAHIARSYGVDLRALAGQSSQQRPAAEGHQAQTVSPELQTVLQPLVQQVQTLQHQLQQSKQQTEQQALTEAQAQVQAFASDPAHMYFDNVRDEVAALLEAGRATTLADAYEKATWASKEIRPLLLADQAKQTQADTQRKAQEQAARSKAQSAQHAAGSVTGAPAPGAAAPQAPHGSIRDQLKAAMQEHGAAV